MADLDREHSTRTHIALMTAAIVGGAALFFFVLYLVIAFAVWLVTNPSVLVYAFLVLVFGQATWLVMAALKRRFEHRRPTTETSEPTSVG